MKKIFLALLCFLPYLVNAQTAQTVKNEFRESVKELAKPFIWSDEINILPINSENKASEIIAIDQGMNTLWSTKIAGYILQCGKFKDQILAVGATENSMYGGLKGEFVAYLLDPKTGKINLQKTLSTPPAKNYLQFTLLFNKTGNTFALVLRETSMSTSLIKMIADGKKYFKTANLTIIGYNEKLDPQYALKPGIANQIVLSVDANEWGDMFVSILKNDHTIETSRYAAGSNVPSGTLGQDIDFHKNIYTDDGSVHVDFLPSKQSRNVIYFALLHENIERDVQLSSVKFDFEQKTNVVAKEIFTKDHIRQIEKAFIHKKGIDKPDIGSSSGLDVRYMEEYNGTLLLAISGRGIMQRGGYYEMAFVINKYNEKLELKFQQVIPVEYALPIYYLSNAFHIDGNYLYTICNNKDGMVKLNTIYGKLDLLTGQWLKLEELSKDNLKGTTVFNGSSTLWYKNGFVIPYLRKVSFVGLKYDINLQSNTY